MELYSLTMHELHEKLCKKEVSAVEITQSVLKRIAAAEDKIKAYITVIGEDALKQAQALDDKNIAGADQSLMLGIPGGIKDNICTKGVKSTAGSKILENFVPPYNATVVENLEEAGAVCIGKTNQDEFGMGSSTENSGFFATRNPWNTDCVPGGSSGGSGAAVAAGEAIWAIGSDTGGSVRLPAAYCGVVGLKPTYGRVSRYGLMAYASSLDTIGPITRDVTDCAILFNVLSSYDEKDSTSINESVPDYRQSLINDVKGLKVGLPKEYFVKGLDGEVEAAIKRAISQYESMGAKIVEVSMPHSEYALAAYYIIATAEASSNLARYDGVSYGHRGAGDDIVAMYKRTREEGFGEEVRRRIMLGTYTLSSGYYDAYYKKALQVRRLVRQDFDKAFEKVDVLLTPVAPTTAFRVGEKTEDPLAMYLMDVCTLPINLAGVPAMSIPCGFSKDNMPIGMQIIAKPLAEETIFRAAYTFEQNNDFANKIGTGVS